MSELELKKIEIMAREVTVKEKELDHKISAADKSAWRSPLVVAVLAATLAAFSNAAITYYSSHLDREAAATKFERDNKLAESAAERERILEMIKIGEPEQVQRNLQFLVDTELVKAPATVASLQNYYKDREPGTGPGTSQTQLTDSGGYSRRQLFKSGTTLTYAFMEKPSAAMLEAVGEAANEWMQHANIRLAFIQNANDAIIRIMPSRTRNASMIGRSALNASADKPTMWLFEHPSFGTSEKAVILHEFGHALGFVHEHQNPSSEIPEDVKKAYEYYVKMSPRNMYLLNKSNVYPCIRDFDPISIMISTIPSEFTVGKVKFGGATALSESDKLCIAQMYPNHTAEE
ncbi:MAG: hypothetical protein COC24_015290 [Alphaproteobacteria bacterium]|nr:hypothetical protein [Alphaproteobacteria bacterium]